MILLQLAGEREREFRDQLEKLRWEEPVLEIARRLPNMAEGREKNWRAARNKLEGST